jgi:16S rRNA (adenine1518-N6/adenine1519-N6)-dimethyltransferase
MTAERLSRPETQRVFRVKKSLGQNFLTDKRVIERIVGSCDLQKDETVLEIGPGHGALTSAILPHVKHVITVETDRVLAENIRKGFSGENVTVHHDDFLKFDFSCLPGPVKIIGNIPYYISSPIINRVLEEKSRITAFFMTAQLEFGQRMVAKPGSKDYSSLTCFVNYFTEPRLLFKISPGAFRPAPKVWSCFMRLDIRREPAVQVQDEHLFLTIIRLAFLQRRKTLVNSLSSMYPKTEMLRILAEIGLNEKIRAEELDLADYARITNKIAN